MTVKNVEKKEKATALVTVELDKQEFEDALNKAYIKSRGKITVPGFRKGKAPRKIIENMYGQGVFYEDAIEEVALSAFTFAVENANLKVVGRPSLADTNISDDKLLTLTFSTGLYPEVVLTKYKGLKSVKKPVEVTDADVDAELETAREKNSRLVTREDRPAEMNDTVVIDFEGFVDGKAFQGGKAEKYSLMLGSGNFIPGFEEQLVGMNLGEDRDIAVKFPDGYSADLSGKDATFKVKLHEIKETVLPEADDEFAKDVSEFDTLAEYKNSLREKLTAEREESAQTLYRQGILEDLVNYLTAEIPESMVDEQLDKMVEDYSMRLQSQGMQLEAYLNMIGMSMDDFLKGGRPNAESQVKVTLALRKIIEMENIDATEEEADAEYKRLAELYKVEEKKVRDLISHDQMINDLKMMKAEKLICDNGIAEEPAPEEEKAEEKPEEADEAPKAEKKAAPRKTAAKAPKAEEKAEESADEKPARKTTRKKKTDEEKDAE